MIAKNPEKPVVQLIETEDGSNSLYVPALNETYHSFHGAIRESEHVFINHGLDYWQKEQKKSTVHILEVGFGTGLNAILTLAYTLDHSITVHYHTLEPYPLDEAIIKQLNYPALLNNEVLKDYFFAIHKAEWNERIAITNQFILHKNKIKLEDYQPEKALYNVVYFDAFAPNKQAELWTPEALSKIYESLAESGILVTYCAKGQFKRDLRAVGFDVQTLPGPPGKKEMVRAIKHK